MWPGRLVVNSSLSRIGPVTQGSLSGPSVAQARECPVVLPDKALYVYFLRRLPTFNHLLIVNKSWLRK